VDENPAADLRAPKVQNRPTMPFTQPEMVKILVAFDKYSKRAGVANAQRLKAFVLLLRLNVAAQRRTLRVGCTERWLPDG
jgi:hypothetical protein